MASLTLKKRDLNRFTKVYPYASFPKRYENVPEGNLQIETNVLNFNEESGPKTYNFTVGFTATPAISAISVTTSTNANVNVYVSSITTSTVSFASSAPFTGQISFTAIQVA